MSEASIKDIVRDKYAEAARRVAAGDGGACCGAEAALGDAIGGSCCGAKAAPAGASAITGNLYGVERRASCPRPQSLPRSAAAIRPRSPS